MLSIKTIYHMMQFNVSTIYDGVVLDMLGTKSNILALFSSLLIFGFIQSKREKEDLFAEFKHENKILRYLIYITAIMLIVINISSLSEGYGNGGFIYGDF